MIVSCAIEWDERWTDMGGASPAKHALLHLAGATVSSLAPEPVPRKSNKIPHPRPKKLLPTIF